MPNATRTRAPRKSVLQPGWITLDGGFAMRSCTVENLSVNGAKITLPDRNPLPSKFRLAMSRDVRNGRPCQIVWRKDRTIGVKFVT